MRATQPATGYTRCPWCKHRFSDEPGRSTTTIPGTVPAPSRRPGYAAGRAGQTVAVDIRWHEDCLADFEERNAELRRQAREDNRAAIETIARDAGLDVEAILADYDRANP